MPRVLIEPGYTIQPKYLDLAEGEQLCPDCNGRGEVVVMYGSPHAGGNRMGQCRKCHGKGKVAYCAKCGAQRHIVRHPDALWMDTLCLECIVADGRLVRADAGEGRDNDEPH